jgi:hypothetical protein
MTADTIICTNNLFYGMKTIITLPSHLKTDPCNKILYCRRNVQVANIFKYLLFAISTFYLVELWHFKYCNYCNIFFERVGLKISYIDLWSLEHLVIQHKHFIRCMNPELSFK